MPRAIWKGAVSFGLVNVPVKLYSATEEHDIRFHQVHRADGGRIRMKRVCQVDGEEIGYDQIAKGYESEDGRVVILDDDDLASLPVSSSREIDVVEFVPSEQVDPILFGKSYYLEPDGRAAKPYALLREALADTDRVGIVKVALRQREALAVLRVRDKVIMLQTLLWPDEIRAADFGVLDDDVELRPQELAMASSLVESMAADFEPDQFEDRYAAAVRDLVERKLEGAPLAPAPADEPTGGDVVDLLTALQRSVERAKANRGEAPAAAEPEAPPAPAAKPAKRAAAKTAAKTAAKATVKAPAATAGKGTASTATTKTAAKTAAKTTKTATATKADTAKSAARTRKSA